MKPRSKSVWMTDAAFGASNRARSSRPALPSGPREVADQPQHGVALADDLLDAARGDAVRRQELGALGVVEPDELGLHLGGDLDHVGLRARPRRERRDVRVVGGERVLVDVGAEDDRLRGDESELSEERCARRVVRSGNATAGSPRLK